MHKISYSKGIREIGNIIKKTKIIPNTINVGGGFPSVYPDLNPEPIINYMEEIKKELNNLKLNKLPEIICEPGRALVACLLYTSPSPRDLWISRMPSSA